MKWQKREEEIKAQEQAKAKAREAAAKKRGRINGLEESQSSSGYNLKAAIAAFKLFRIIQHGLIIL